MFRLLVRNQDQFGARLVDREKSKMVPEPTKFIGTWSKLRPFLIQLNLKLTANATSRTVPEYQVRPILAASLSITVISYSVNSTVPNFLPPSLTVPVLIVS